MLKKIMTVLFIVLAGFTLFQGKKLLEKKKEEIAKEPLPLVNRIRVNLFRAEDGKLKDKEKFLAQIKAKKSIKLSTKLAGYIKKIYVNESDFVEKGDVLVEIDKEEILLNIKSLDSAILSQKSDLAFAKEVYNRNLKLYRVGALAKEKLDASRVALKAKESNLKSTKAKKAQLKHQLSYLKIKAPFSGYIEAILLQEGDLAATGRPIIAMYNGKKRVLFSFSPKSSSIKPSLSVINRGEKIGYIDRIYPTAKNALAVAEIKLTKDIPLPLGSNLEIEVITKESNGCIIPNGAMLHKKDGIYILIYKDREFNLKKIEPIFSSDSKTMIKSCPTEPFAVAPESKLARLLVYKHIEINGDNNE
jgi:RND family efflux transporter MFP subunit